MEESGPAKDDIKASTPSVAPVRPAYRGDGPGMAAMGQPIVNNRPNLSALDGRLAFPLMSGNEQDDAVPVPDCLVEHMVDGGPRSVKRVAMKVKHPVDRNTSISDAFVPAPVQRRAGKRPRRRGRRRHDS